MVKYDLPKRNEVRINIHDDGLSLWCFPYKDLYDFKNNVVIEKEWDRSCDIMNIKESYYYNHDVYLETRHVERAARKLKRDMKKDIRDMIKEHDLIFKDWKVKIVDTRQMSWCFD